MKIQKRHHMRVLVQDMGGKVSRSDAAKQASLGHLGSLHGSRRFANVAQSVGARKRPGGKYRLATRRADINSVLAIDHGMRYSFPQTRQTGILRQ
jgi:hypothetical protein